MSNNRLTKTKFVNEEGNWEDIGGSIYLSLSEWNYHE